MDNVTFGIIVGIVIGGMIIAAWTYELAARGVFRNIRLNIKYAIEKRKSKKAAKIRAIEWEAGRAEREAKQQQDEQRRRQAFEKSKARWGAMSDEEKLASYFEEIDYAYLKAYLKIEKFIQLNSKHYKEINPRRYLPRIDIKELYAFHCRIPGYETNDNRRETLDEIIKTVNNWADIKYEFLQDLTRLDNIYHFEIKDSDIKKSKLHFDMTCPNCGGPLKLKNGNYVCAKCGTEI